MISCSSAWKISTPISPGPRRRCRGPARRRDRTGTDQRRSLPDHLPREDMTAGYRRQRLPLLRRRDACDRRDRQRDAGLCAGAPAGAAHPPPQIWLPRLRNDPSGSRRPSGRSRRAWQAQRCSPMCWSANIAITFRSIASPRSSPATASTQSLDPRELGGRRRWWLEPLRARLAEHVFASRQAVRRRHTDPGARSRPRPHTTGRLWVYARDDRPWAGSDPPAAVYLLQPGPQGRTAAAHLDRFRGIFRSTAIPGSSGYRARRHRAGGLLGPYAAEVLRRASSDRLADRRRGAAAHRRALCDRDRTSAAQSADARAGVRDARSRPLVRGDETLARDSSSAGSRRAAVSPRPSAMPSRAGPRFAASSTMDASNSTPTPSSARSAPSLWAARTTCLPVRTAARDRWAVVASLHHHREAQ